MKASALWALRTRSADEWRKRRSRRASRSRAGGAAMLGSRRATLVLLPPRVCRRLALRRHHADARAADPAPQRRVGVEVYARAPAGASGVVGVVAGSRVGLAPRGRAQAVAARGEAGPRSRLARHVAAGAASTRRARHFACEAFLTGGSRSACMPSCSLTASFLTSEA